MKLILLILAVVALVGCVTEAKKNPTSTLAVASQYPIVDGLVRRRINKPTGALTRADYEKVTNISLGNGRLQPNGWKYTKLSPIPPNEWILGFGQLEKLTQLMKLDLQTNQLTEVPKSLTESALSSLRKPYTTILIQGSSEN